jgi:hypothetical protein
MGLIVLIQLVYRDFHRTRPNGIIALEFVMGLLFLAPYIFGYPIRGNYTLVLMGLIFLIHAVGQKYRKDGLVINIAVCLVVLSLLMAMYDVIFGA